jgi:site-specific DNA-methyltransferase (adenine-specific)
MASRGVDKGIQGGKFASGESAYTPTKLVTAPATDAAREWQGWGTALKPAWEPIILARKPLIGTVAANVQQHGTGALNIDGCRVATTDNLNGGTYSEGGNKSSLPGDTRTTAAAGMFAEGEGRIPGGFVQPEGRWPANICHDGSDEVLAVFPQTGKSSGGKGNASGLIDGGVYGAYSGENKGQNAGGLGDSGSAARFFYCAKASKKDCGEGNTHPTVKPLTLMEWLVTLVTPPGGTVLDPFAGSCTTGVAAQNLGHRFVCIEQDADYAAIGITRLRTVDAA